jgi:hypothetical protein
MKHITILYGDDNTGKTYLCRQAGWTILSGTPQEVKDMLEEMSSRLVNPPYTEFALPIDTAEDQGLYVGPVRAVIHEFAKANGYIVRYADLRVVE